MIEPPPRPLTPQEARELCVALVAWCATILGPAVGFEWLRRVERERERREALSAKGLER